MRPRKPSKSKPPKRRYRTRHEPPTLDEAIFAAQGLSDEIAAQIEITASLTGLAPDEVRSQVLERAALRRVEHHTVVTRRAGMAQRVVVERKPTRRLIPPRPDR
ncbi:MAG: hypothetical protein U1E53_30475 [Dongiaceae bacterium]